MPMWKKSPAKVAMFEQQLKIHYDEDEARHKNN